MIVKSESGRKKVKSDCVVVKKVSGGEDIKVMLGFFRGGWKRDVHLHQGKAPGPIIFIIILMI